MMRRLTLATTSVLLSVVFFANCNPTPLDLNNFADRIEAQLKNKPVGYAFVISKLGQASVKRAWGIARRAPDSPAMNMSVDVKYTTASVSKNITAAAMLKLLDDTNLKKKDLTLDQKLNEKIVDYLPWNWKPGAGVETITFRDLFRHRAGIRCKDFVDYQNMKKCLAGGIVESDKQKDCNGNVVADNVIGCYNNINYALFRVIIPVMMGQLKKPVLSTFTEEQTDTENASFAANVYIRYVNEKVFAKAGLPEIFCRPTDGAQQGLAYKQAAPTGNGTDFGDDTITCGSEGWFLSADQLAKYFQTLNTTNTIVAPAIQSRMRDELLGYDGSGSFETPAGKITYWSKPGGHPASMNPGEINTLLVHYSNGVEVAIVINSDFNPAGYDYAGLINTSLSDLMNGK